MGTGQQLPHRESLVVQVADFLRNEIAQGRWKGQLPALRALSDVLGVSKGTLEKAERLLQRQGILQIAQGRRTRIRRSPRMRSRNTKSDIVRALVPQPLDMLLPSTLFSIARLQRHLHDVGFALQVHNDARLSQTRFHKRMQTLVEANPAACWILFSVGATVQQWFMAHEIPCLVDGHVYPGIRLPSIDALYEAACQHAVHKCIQSGHRRFALLIPQRARPGKHAGEVAVQEAFEAIPCPVCVTRVVEHLGTVGSICLAVDSLLNATPPFTGILVFDPENVLTVVSHVMDAGRRTPDDISVICLQHEQYLDCHVPSIACYHVDRGKYAARMSRLVVQLATEGYLTARARRVMPEFRAGGSFAPRKKQRRT